MACSDEKGSATDSTASVGDGEDFPVPPSVVAAAAAAELGFPAPGNKVLLNSHYSEGLMCPPAAGLTGTPLPQDSGSACCS